MKIFFIQHLRKFAIISLIIFILLEIFVFNYKSFLINPINSSKYQQQGFDTSNTQMSQLSPTENIGFYQVTADNPTLTFEMNTPVKTMHLNIQREDTNDPELTVNIAYATESRTKFINSDKAFSIIKNLPSSEYVTCSYFGNVQKIQLKIAAKKGNILRIGGFYVNEKIPMNFSIFRTLFLFLLSCLIYTFLKYPAFQKSYNLKIRSHRYTVVFTLLTFSLFVIFVYNMYIGDYYWFKNTTGNQITQELVDAFERGQVHLVDEVPPELLSLKNPYDWSERIAAGINCKWDHLLYNGKYYSYYGIGPVLTLFLPYHMITGYYFSSSLACLLYTLTASIFVGLCFLSIVKNWFYKTPFKIVILGTIITMFSSCAFINVLATNFYEIAQSSALCFLLVGFYFMLNSGIFTKNKIQLGYLFFSALFVALSVLCRATCAVYAIVMVFWIIYGFIQYMSNKKKNRIAALKYIFASISPYVIFGIIQMTYNYLRFENPLEFGIGYTLTIYDYTNIDMHFSLIMVSIINFIFAVPVINTQFPFIHNNFDSLNVNGYYFVATKPTIGILPAVLPIFSLFYAPKLAKNFTRKEKLRLFLIWFLPGIIFPIILVAMTWEYGYAMRYNADFAWQMCIAAFVVIFYVYNRIKRQADKKWLFRILFTATIWCVLCYLAVIFSKVPDNSLPTITNSASVYYRIRNLIAFWY